MASWTRRSRGLFLNQPIEIGPRLAAEKLAELGAAIVSRADWERRAGRVRRGILEASRLEPLPARSPLAPIRRGGWTGRSYRVENVAFESFPGFFVTGNLYRPPPSGRRSPRAAAGVLVPHGHTKWWRGSLRGRFSAPIQTLCSTLARMGAVVLTYDMVGWGEADQAPHRSTDNTIGIQLWNSTRALDFLLSLPELEGRPIAAVGFSGGATQTILLAAVDRRVAASVPVAQVSAHFFGGCPCERGMSIHSRHTPATNNAEIAALAAPRPQLLVSTGEDWTRNTPRVEFPYLQRIYSLLGAGDAAENLHLGDQGHDFGLSKRDGVYRFLARHLELDLAAVALAGGELDENETVVRPRSSLRVFDRQRPRPAGALVGARAVSEAFRGLPRSE